MGMDHDVAGNLAEYHARQRANMASDEAASAQYALSNVRNRIRTAKGRLEKALKLLDEGTTAAARGEIEAVLADLEKLRL